MADHNGGDRNGHVNGHFKTASANGTPPPCSDSSAELEPSLSGAEDRIAELLAAYDDALASGCEAEISFPLGDLDPDSIAKLERLVAKARAVRRVQETLLETGQPARDSTHVDCGAANPTGNNAPIPGHNLTGPAESPKTLGRFEFVRELGSGGSGTVFLARDPVLGRFVALKIPRPETLFTKDLHRRFFREAQAAARLTHPNLVPVYEVGEAGSVCYIAAAFCEGPRPGRLVSPTGRTATCNVCGQARRPIGRRHRLRP